MTATASNRSQVLRKATAFPFGGLMKNAEVECRKVDSLGSPVINVARLEPGLVSARLVIH